MPAAAAINVVENEDAARVYEEAARLYGECSIARVGASGQVQGHARPEFCFFVASARAGLCVMPGQAARLDRALENKRAVQHNAWRVFLGWLWGHLQVSPLGESFVIMKACLIKGQASCLWEPHSVAGPSGD